MAISSLLNKAQPIGSRILETVESADVHDHLCLIYRDKEEGVRSAVAFIKAGLAKNDRCVYITDDNTAEAVRQTMQLQGIEVESALSSGKLIFGTKQDAYLSDGYFEPDKAIKFFAKAADQAAAEGYRAIRGAAEMTWQLGGDPGSDRLLEYESKMNELLFPTHEAVGLCQFNSNRFTPAFLRDVIYTHPLVMIGGLVCKNFYYKPPEEYLQATSSMAQELEVERMLGNIFDFEKNELELHQSKKELKESNDRLEQKVAERTAELQSKTDSLKELNRQMVGREYRIRELEFEVSLLKQRLDRELGA
jgi:hypothetical protein